MLEGLYLQLTGYLVPAELVGHVGYIITLAAYVVRDILKLRVLVVVACATMAVYFSVAVSQVAWTPLFWQVLLLVVNLVWIVMLLRERRDVLLSDEERELHETLFRDFSALEFLKLVRAGEWVDLDEGSKLTRRGETVRRLYLVSNGEVEVDAGDGARQRLRDGALIGEMSFLSGKPATATVHTVTPVRSLAWEQDQLTRLLQRNPSMRGAVMSVIGADLTRKLAVPPQSENGKEVLAQGG